MNLKAEAERILNTTLTYWFRQKYNLSPKDPNYLNCEPWEIELDFELDQEWNRKVESHLKKNKQVKTCPDCGQIFSGYSCPSCGRDVGHSTEHFEDPNFDEYFDQVDQECKEYFTKGLKWEEVPDTEPIPEIKEPTDEIEE